MATFTSNAIYGAYGEPPQYLPPSQWCSIEASLSSNGSKINYTLRVYSSRNYERYNIYLTANIGGTQVYTNYLGYNSYYCDDGDNPWTYSSNVDFSNSMIGSNGKIAVSFTLGVGANWRTTTASGEIAAGKPTANLPTRGTITKGYPVSNPTTLIANYSTVRINMTGTPHSATQSPIKTYILFLDGAQVYSGSNNYYVLPAQTAGNHKVKTKVIDNNGVTSDFSSELTLSYKTYTPPVITKVTSQRWSSNNPTTGHAQDDGTYARLYLEFTPGKIDGSGIDTTWKVKVDSYTSANQVNNSGVAVCTTNNIISTNQSYIATYSIWDAYISSPTIDKNDIISVGGYGALDLYFENGVHGIGFGAKAQAGYADCAFTPRFMQQGTLKTLQQIILDYTYPVGSIFTTTNPNFSTKTQVENYFGGTWEQIKGRFLLAAGSNDANTDNTYGTNTAGTINRSVGEKGGSKEVAEHTHPDAVFETRPYYHNGSIEQLSWEATNTSMSTGTSWSDSATWSGVSGTGQYITIKTVKNTGGSANGQLPPYLTVYMWQRTA